MAKPNLPLASWMRFGVLACPECGANENHISSDEEYAYECKKCQSYTLRPIEEDKPMTPAIKSNIMEGQLTETICTECGKLFRKLKKNARSLCPHCQNLKLCADYRERNRIGAYRRRMTA